jgi:hypothetical protein
MVPYVQSDMMIRKLQPLLTGIASFFQLILNSDIDATAMKSITGFEVSGAVDRTWSSSLTANSLEVTNRLSKDFTKQSR